MFFDLAMHKECAEYASLACPYIANGKAYGNTIKETKGATIYELCPRDALNNDGIPIFMARGRRSGIRPAVAKSEDTKPALVVLAGKLYDITPVGFYANKQG